MVAALASRELAGTVNRKRVQRLMREHRLLQPERSEARRRRPGYFQVTRPDELWHLAAAAELPKVSLEDALGILIVLAQRGDPRLRALGDPDAFPGSDLGVVKAVRALGLPSSPAAVGAASARWRPWRAYAVQHLWATGDHAVNRLPGGGVAG